MKRGSGRSWHSCWGRSPHTPTRTCSGAVPSRPTSARASGSSPSPSWPLRPRCSCVASFGGVTVPACAYGEPSPSSVPWTTDQFGNSGLDNYGRMLGPRYPHSWSRVMTRQCEDYLVFFNNYTTTPPVITHRLFISVSSPRRLFNALDSHGCFFRLRSRGPVVGWFAARFEERRGAGEASISPTTSTDCAAAPSPAAGTSEAVLASSAASAAGRSSTGSCRCCAPHDPWSKMEESSCLGISVVSYVNRCSFLRTAF